MSEPQTEASTEQAIRELRDYASATELQVSSAEIDRFLAERAARAAAGGSHDRA